MSLCLAFFVLTLSCVNANAATIQNMIDANLSTAQLANKYLIVSNTINNNGSDVRQVENVDTLKLRLETLYPKMNKIDLAYLIYECIGENPVVLANLPDEKVLEVLNFKNYIQTTDYIKSNSDGNKTYLSKGDLIRELILNIH